MLAAETLPNFPQLTAEQAEPWIAAALAEAKALRQYDGRLYPQAGDAEALRVAEQLRIAWRRWAHDAEALYDRVRPLLRSHVAGAHDLDYTIGWARAMLKLTPEAIHEAREQIARGETKSAEEVRRELRATAHR